MSLPARLYIQINVCSLSTVHCLPDSCTLKWVVNCAKSSLLNTLISQSVSSFFWPFKFASSLSLTHPLSAAEKSHSIKFYDHHSFPFSHWVNKKCFRIVYEDSQSLPVLPLFISVKFNKHEFKFIFASIQVSIICTAYSGNTSQC